jgi:DNA repair protein RadC
MTMTATQRSEAARKAAATRRAASAASAIEGVYSVESGAVAGGLIYEAPVISMRIVRDSGAAVPRSIKSPADIAAMLSERYACADREIMVVVLLDTKNHVLAVEPIAVGGLDYAMISMREVFKGAIMIGAASMVLAHNHPSGDPTPSPEDVVLTRRIVQAGEMLEIAVLDHIVLGAGRWVSLREKNLGFSK